MQTKDIQVYVSENQTNSEGYYAVFFILLNNKTHTVYQNCSGGQREALQLKFIWVGELRFHSTDNNNDSKSFSWMQL